jgi:uncharacterized membrane protein (DUF106 family)
MNKERMFEIKKRQKELQKEIKEHQKAGNHTKVMELNKEMFSFVAHLDSIWIHKKRLFHNNYCLNLVLVVLAWSNNRKHGLQKSFQDALTNESSFS